MKTSKSRTSFPAVNLPHWRLGAGPLAWLTVCLTFLGLGEVYHAQAYTSAGIGYGAYSIQPAGGSVGDLVLREGSVESDVDCSDLVIPDGEPRPMGFVTASTLGSKIKFSLQGPTDPAVDVLGPSSTTYSGAIGDTIYFNNVPFPISITLSFRADGFIHPNPLYADTDHLGGAIVTGGFMVYGDSFGTPEGYIFVSGSGSLISPDGHGNNGGTSISFQLADPSYNPDNGFNGRFLADPETGYADTGYQSFTLLLIPGGADGQYTPTDFAVQFSATVQGYIFSSGSLDFSRTVGVDVTVPVGVAFSTESGAMPNVTYVNPDGTPVNTSPSIETLALDATSITENDSVTLTGSLTDPDSTDTHTVAINWGDGSADTTLDLPAGILDFSAVHQYLDDAPSGTPSDVQTINVTVTDSSGGSASDSTSLAVNNAAPEILGVTCPEDPIALGDLASLAVDFSDVGTLDTHTVFISWNDGTSDTVLNDGGFIRTANHIYAAPGIYKVDVTVEDDDTGRATTSFNYVVVYDPDGGFVTGGGWILSPPGACVVDPTLTGKAAFGFVSKYQKGANVPTGNTEFQFKAGDLNFSSTAYQWLVVSGAKAQYKGDGTINGTGSYGFLLTATDGDAQNGGDGLDKFRIKIWDKASGVVVYDNVLGASDDLDAANPQVIGGGSIVIHSQNGQ